MAVEPSDMSRIDILMSVALRAGLTITRRDDATGATVLFTLPLGR